MRNKTGIYGSPVSYSLSPLVFKHIWKALNLENEGYEYGSYECSAIEGADCPWRLNMQKSDHIGSSITMPLKLAVIPYLDELTPEAKAMGSVNTTKLEERNGKIVHIGTNIDAKAIKNSLREALTGSASPFGPESPSTFAPGKAAALVIGGGGASRAAIYALFEMQLSPVYILNRDPIESAAILQQFPAVDLRVLNDSEQAAAELQNLEAQGIRLCLGVGCIPSVEAQTEGEQMVYDVARTIFGHSYLTSSPDCSNEIAHLKIPEKALFFDMAYKPNMTLLRTLAEKSGWQTGSGIDIVAENCFEQAEWWLGQSVPADARQHIRDIVRQHQ